MITSTSNQQMKNLTALIKKARERKKQNAFVVEGIKIQQHLRDKGVIAEIDLQDRSIKGQMKQAGKNNAEYTVIIGANEMEKKEAAVKNMENGKQQDIPFLKVSDFITESSRQ